jgi:hypothetical protein
MPDATCYLSYNPIPCHRIHTQILCRSIIYRFNKQQVSEDHVVYNSQQIDEGVILLLHKNGRGRQMERKKRALSQIQRQLSKDKRENEKPVALPGPTLSIMPILYRSMQSTPYVSRWKNEPQKFRALLVVPNTANASPSFRVAIQRPIIDFDDPKIPCLYAISKRRSTTPTQSQ